MLLGFVLHFKTKVPVVLVGVHFHAEGVLHVKWMALGGGRALLQPHGLSVAAWGLPRSQGQPDALAWALCSSGLFLPPKPGCCDTPRLGGSLGDADIQT